MSYRDFNLTVNKLPAIDGKYLRDAPFGQVPVIYHGGIWFLASNNDRLPDSVVKRWR